MFARSVNIRNILTLALLFLLALAGLVVLLSAFSPTGSSPLLLALKIIAAISLLAVWVVLNIPPPAPPVATLC